MTREDAPPAAVAVIGAIFVLGFAPLAWGKLLIVATLSAASATIIVATLALSTMVSNHVVMPIWLAVKDEGASVSGDTSSCGSEIESDSQSMADRGAPSAAAAPPEKPPKMARTGNRRRYAQLFAIQLHRRADIGLIRAQVADIGIPEHSRRQNDDQKEQQLQKSHHLNNLLPQPLFSGVSPGAHASFARVVREL